MAPDASLIRSGENGTGIGSRWYPDTLVDRLRGIAEYSDKLLLCESDGVRLLELLCKQPNTAFFVDPPYTADGGAYSSELDHFGFVNSTTLSVIAWLDSVNETSGRFDASGTAILTYFSALNRR